MIDRNTIIAPNWTLTAVVDWLNGTQNNKAMIFIAISKT